MEDFFATLAPRHAAQGPPFQKWSATDHAIRNTPANSSSQLGAHFGRNRAQPRRIVAKGEPGPESLQKTPSVQLRRQTRRMLRPGMRQQYPQGVLILRF
jgi:hypothetical protein